MSLRRATRVFIVAVTLAVVAVALALGAVHRQSAPPSPTSRPLPTLAITCLPSNKQDYPGCRFKYQTP